MSRMTDQIGRVLSGRYRLIAPLGTGSSAQVYLADDVRLRRRVAVKLLHAALADDETFLRRFRAEAQAAAALSHPNILAVYDWGDDDGTPYIVTEYLAGGSLRSILDEGGRLSPAQAVAIGLEATRALAYAHRRGFVHRDIKPANLLFGDDGRLRVADFGLARALAEAAWTEPQGAVVGTARYASPEQAQGESVDGRADVYSLGLVLIEAVTGTVPFTADTTIATLMARIGRSVPVPDSLGPLQGPLQRAGQASAADRLDASELSVALAACADDLPRPEPLSLQASRPVVDLTGGVDATMHGGSAHSPSSLAVPGAATVAAAAAAAPAPVSAGVDDDLAQDPYRPPRRRRWPLILVTVLIAGLLGVGAAWAMSESRTPSYEVPALVGTTEEDALEFVDGYGWDVERRTERRDGSTPGRVLATEPLAGEMLDEGDTLVIVVSLGNTLAPVPGDLVGKPIEEATAALEAAGGFVPEVVAEEHSEDQAEGVVLGVAPETSGEQPKGTAVRLTVSKGPAPRTVPAGLVGMTFDEAKAALAAVQLGAVQVDQFSETVEAGTVVGARPAAGSQVPRDTRVEVVVSKGPDVVTVPDVSGLTAAAAVAKVEAAGLVVSDVAGPPNGTPFDTRPAVGTQVRRGTSVVIYTEP